jgi:hypothetical protein
VNATSGRFTVVLGACPVGGCPVCGESKETERQACPLCSWTKDMESVVGARAVHLDRAIECARTDEQIARVNGLASGRIALVNAWCGERFTWAPTGRKAGERGLDVTCTVLPARSRTDRYRVTHAKSGLALPGYYRTIKSAKAAMQALLALDVDWSLPAGNSQYNLDLRDRCVIVASEHGSI